jgi:hypothetical protein
MKLTLVTATGDRPEAFALCERWMARQTRQPDEWIVADDGFEPTVCTMGQTVLRFEPGLPAYKSLARNVTEAVKAGGGDLYIFIEDDECYLPEHLAEQERRIEAGAMLAGCCIQKYYHLPSRSWRELRNRCACLCQTAMHADMRENLYAAADLAVRSGHWNIDASLWADRNQNIPVDLYETPQHVIGMKGLPGRGGIGVGHRPNRNHWNIDTHDYAKLREWVGEDLEAYVQLA